MDLFCDSVIAAKNKTKQQKKENQIDIIFKKYALVVFLDSRRSPEVVDDATAGYYREMYNRYSHILFGSACSGYMSRQFLIIRICFVTRSYVDYVQNLVAQH